MALNNYLPMYESLLTDLKFYRLQDELSIEEDQALMILVRFWFWGSKHADMDGKLGQYNEKHVDRAIRRPNDPAGICAALIHAGFVDQDGPSGLRIHNWIKYAGALVAERERWRTVKKAQREKNFQAEMRRAGSCEGGQQAPDLQGSPETKPEVPEDVPETMPGHLKDNAGNSPTNITLPYNPIFDMTSHDATEGIGGSGEKETELYPFAFSEDQVNQLVNKHGPTLAQQIIVKSRESIEKLKSTNPEAVISADYWNRIIALQERAVIGMT